MDTVKCEILFTIDRAEQRDRACKNICPFYDEEDEHWIAIMSLSNEMKSVKEQIDKHETNRNDILSSETGGTLLAHDFLKSAYNESRLPRINIFFWKYPEKDDVNSSKTIKSNNISLVSEIEGSNDTVSVGR